MRRRRITVVVMVTAFALAAMGRAAAHPQPIDLAAAINYRHWQATGHWLAGEYPLDVYARDVAERIADAGVLLHSDIGSLLEGCRWAVVGENLGVGPDVAAIVDGWMASPSHADNIVADFTHLGVGLVTQGGRLWAVAVFAKAGGS